MAEGQDDSDLAAAQAVIANLVAEARAEGYRDGFDAGVKVGFEHSITTLHGADLSELLMGSDATSSFLPRETPIEELDLTIRSYNSLKRKGLHTIGAVLAAGAAELRDIPRFGPKCMDEVTEALARAGHALPGTDVNDR